MDFHTGFDFEHRRQWIVDRMKFLSSVFAIDLCAYAVMSNHYHIVIRIDAEQAKLWSDEEVARRWMQIFSGSLLMHQFLAKANLTGSELKHVATLLKKWRERLIDLSWYMRCLNEPIARMANSEDHCTGRFWEGRFKSQALLDTRAVLACMAYVDLNPVRAAMAKTPEHSDYTSVQERILDPETSSLRKFIEKCDDGVGIPISLSDYLELVDWGGREIKQSKPGYIPDHAPPILKRLKMDVVPVLNYLGHSKRTSFGAMGPVSKLRVFAKSIGKKFVKGQVLGRQLCPEQA